ncbi:MAG TPA: CueP family metal-binding protein [Pseudogracilibacillus sp.]|nr:CueP family metal-binding protein [Pseudogracilibacillus sp.]
MKVKNWLILILASILLVACSNEEETTKQGETEDIKELVHTYSVEDIEDETASITSKELIVTSEDETETVYPLPEDEFFVSIAPFINETHPCKDHSLTGCQGELVQESFDVTIEDETGNIVLEDTIQTEKNGFFDLWLPRDQTYNIKMEHDGKNVDAAFSTFEEDGTCITTMQLTE